MASEGTGRGGATSASARNQPLADIAGDWLVSTWRGQPHPDVRRWRRNLTGDDVLTRLTEFVGGDIEESTLEAAVSDLGARWTVTDPGNTEMVLLGEARLPIERALLLGGIATNRIVMASAERVLTDFLTRTTTDGFHSVRLNLSRSVSGVLSRQVVVGAWTPWNAAARIIAGLQKGRYAQAIAVLTRARPKSVWIGRSTDPQSQDYLDVMLARRPLAQVLPLARAVGVPLSGPRLLAWGASRRLTTLPLATLSIGRDDVPTLRIATSIENES